MSPQQPRNGAAAPAPPMLRQRRGSTAAETVVAAAREVEAKIETALTVLWDDLPAWRRDNQYITRGYRHTSNSFDKSFASLGYLHNESVNIWTHLLGAVAFAGTGSALYSLLAPRYPSASGADVRAFACFFVGAFLCLGMSATYHTLCNHSPGVAKVGNKLDYTGIVFLIMGSYVPALYYGLRCHGFLLTIYTSAILALGCACLTVSWFDHFRTPAWRPYRALMFTGLGLSGVVPIFHGMSLYSYSQLNSMMGLNWIVLEGFLYIFGAFLYAACWPERQFPGTVDIFGSSHQIFHVCVVLAAASHLYGITTAFDFHHSGIGVQC
ncbi:hemolysin-III related-domain-containing protein [Lasiosphaeria hispida]|uniref:Hemolysin-III related-domain-containing protein n=1 Tax=Lasiosphaeria hispida TaxID=260671 RepID=A0AAJ0MDT6_9PEZI|nr:hemolysin-III related-domain-containing protein [Lasiosphaeria hispida]